MRAEGSLNAVDCHLKSPIHKKQPEKGRAPRKAVQRMALWEERKLELELQSQLEL